VTSFAGCARTLTSHHRRCKHSRSLRSYSHFKRFHSDDSGLTAIVLSMIANSCWSPSRTQPAPSNDMPTQERTFSFFVVEWEFELARLVGVPETPQAVAPTASAFQTLPLHSAPPRYEFFCRHFRFVEFRSCSPGGGPWSIQWPSDRRRDGGWKNSDGRHPPIRQ